MGGLQKNHSWAGLGDSSRQQTMAACDATQSEAHSQPRGSLSFWQLNQLSPVSASTAYWSLNISCTCMPLLEGAELQAGVMQHDSAAIM